MGKDKSKNLVGQPLFKQIVKMLPKDEFDLLVAKCGSDRYYKTFFFLGTAYSDALRHLFTLRFHGGSL
jgi:hypothetical protein